jgi:hypothetical protein
MWLMSVALSTVSRIAVSPLLLNILRPACLSSQTVWGINRALTNSGLCYIAAQLPFEPMRHHRSHFEILCSVRDALPTDLKLDVQQVSQTFPRH